MTGRQKSFHVVPTTLVKPGPTKPMTSKEAKKAYRKAQALPKMSKAEQRRLEAEELARQAKEFERERAAIRSKAARDRKIKKELAEKAERKSMGIPEKSKWVRPSQPTIDCFAGLKLALKRGREDIESGSETMYDDSHLAKRKRPDATIEEDDDEFGDFPSLSQIEIQVPIIAEQPKTSSNCSSNNSIEATSCNIETGDLFASSPMLLDSSMKMLHGSGTNTLKSPRSLESATNPKRSGFDGVFTSATRHHTSEKVSTPSKTHLKRVTEDLAPSSEKLISMEKDQPREWTRPGKPTETTLGRKMGSTDQQLHSTPCSRSPLKLAQHNSVNMPPPPLPHKSITTSLDSKTQKISQTVSLSSFLQCAPSSTQLFLESHLDDFFPSPSQQRRELLEDDVVGDCDFNFLSSQDLEISSQDLREIETPSKFLSNRAQPMSSPEADLGLTLSVVVSEAKPNTKPRFFEEKEDDLLQAAIRESLALSNLPKSALVTDNISASTQRMLKRAFQRVMSTNSDYGDDEFGFDGIEIDGELLAALNDAEKENR